MSHQAPVATPAPAEEDVSLVRVCPHCGAIAEADDQICHRCWRDISGVDPTVEAGETATGRRRLLGAVRTRRLRIVALLLLGAAAFWVWAEFIKPPTPIGQPPSLSTRAMPIGADAWPVDGGDLGRLRASPVTPDLDASIAWRTALGEAPAVQPITDGSRVYVSLVDGDLVAVELATGVEVWRQRLPGRLDASPAVAGDTVYVGIRDGRVVALDAATGNGRWLHELNNIVHTSPVVVDGLVFVAASTRLYALDAEDGSEVWSHGLGGSFVAASPAIAGDRIAVATNERVLLFDRRTGVQRYFYRLNNPAFVAARDNAIFAYGPTRLVALKPDSTTPWWEPVRGAWANFYILGIAPEVPVPDAYWWRRVPDGAFAPAVEAESVVLSWRNGLVRSYDVATSEVRWEQELGATVGGPTATAGGIVAIRPDEIVLLDRSDGERLAQRRFEGESLRDVVVVEAGMIVSTAGGELLLLR